jgi:Tol biopolymer transport system component
VAIKVCAERFSDRFEQEARAIAQLNHPHICTLYDVGPNYLVMELLEGETLSALLRRGALGIQQVLGYGIQVADALAAAHAKGIIHRDLKPGNVMITKSGVKVLDFGLAKTTNQDETQTLTGAVMGTPAYMAPEQLEGKPCDTRTDIYAEGLILFEMAFGKRPQRDQARSLDGLPGLPPMFAHVVERCLANEPEQRWHSAADLRLELEWARNTPPVVRAAATQSWMRRAWPALAIIAVAAFALVSLPRSLVRQIVTYRFSPFATEAGEENYPAWAPDGKTIAYFAEVNGVKQIFTKALGSPTPAQITKSSTDCTNPFWSPDGTRIYYLSGGLWSVGAAGGEPASVIKELQAAAVSSTNSFAFVRGIGGSMSLWIKPPSAPEPTHYRQAPFPERFARSWTLDFSHDGSKLAVLMERAGTVGFTTELWIVPLPFGTPKRVLDSQPFAVPALRRISWLPDNRHLVCDAPIPGVPGNHLHLVDTKNQTINPITYGTGDEWAPAVSPDGRRVAFSVGKNDFDIIQVSIDGLETRTLLGTSTREDSPAWSPSGRQFAYITDSDGGPELWVRSVQERWATPVLKQGTEGLPLWYGLERPSFSPDGERIVYGANGSRHAIWVSSAQGGRPVPLDVESYDQHGAAWSPDGNWIAYQRFHEGRWELVKVPVGGGKPIWLANSDAGGGDTAWSPTGEWIAFVKSSEMQLISPDSKAHKLLSISRPAAFGFSKDGTVVYSICRGPNRVWELVVSDFETGKSLKRDLRLPVSAIVSGFSLHPNGKSFITSVGVAKFDIWLLDGLK